MTQSTDLPGKWAWYGTWLPRLAAAIVVGLAVGFGSIWVFKGTADFLLTLLITSFLALAMLPAVDALSRRGWRRGGAALLVMLGGAVLAVIFFLSIFEVLTNQILNFLDDLPGLIDKVTVWLQDNLDIEFQPSEFQEEVGSVEEFLEGPGSDLVGGILGIAGSALGFFFRMLTIGLFLFYALKDWPKLRAAMLSRMAPENQYTADTVLTIAIEKTGGYIYSRGLLAAISAVYHFGAFWLIGLPYPLPLALWVGIISQFIPTVGTYIAGAVPVILALISDDPADAVWVLLAILVYQQIENYLLEPRISADTMNLHPAVAFGSAIIGGSLLGVVGALLALPFAATVTALAQTYGDRYELVESERFESPEQYEARMAGYRDEKEAKKARKHGKPSPDDRPDA